MLNLSHFLPKLEKLGPWKVEHRGPNQSQYTCHTPECDKKHEATLTHKSMSVRVRLCAECFSSAAKNPANYEG